MGDPSAHFLVKVKIGVGPGVGAAADMGAERFFGFIDSCERIGWDSIWFSERAGGNILDPLAAMSVAIGRSKRLKYGFSVLVLPGRHPVLLAKELATMDVLSEGRIVAAFGLGSPLPDESAIFGVARKERAARTDEATRLITRLWTEDNVTFDGKYFTVRDFTLRPKPVQSPHPDIWFGGHSEAACRRVGRIGTGWLPSFVAPSEYKAKVDLIKQVAEEHEREIENDHYGALVAYIPPGREEAADNVLSVLQARRPEVDAREIVAVGGHDDLRAKFEELIAQGGSKFVAIPAVPPIDWDDELQRLYDNVVVPLES